MNPDGQEIQIPLQTGSELRIKNNGETSVDNRELELAKNAKAADVVVSYRFGQSTGEHLLRLLEPVADYQHLQAHRRDD